MTLLKGAALGEEPCSCDIAEEVTRKDAELRAAEEEMAHLNEQHLNGHLAKQCIPIRERAGGAANARCTAALEPRPTRHRRAFVSECSQGHWSEDEGCFSSSDTQGSVSASSSTHSPDNSVKDRSHSSDSSSMLGDPEASESADVQAACGRHDPRHHCNGYAVALGHPAESQQMPAAADQKRPIGASGATADLQAEAHGQMLELMICPGDLLFAEDMLESGPMSCASVCVVLASPILLPRCHRDAQKFASTLSTGDGSNLWLICVLERSAQEQQLQSARKVFYVERSSRRLMLAGDADRGGTMKHVPMELQQSPVWLRARMRIDLVRQAVSDMSSPCLEWLVDAIGTNKALQPFLEAWQCKSSSSSVGIAVIFWQLYLVAMAESTRGEDTPGSLLMKWMPLAAHKAETGDLRSILKATGWISVLQIPVLEPPLIGTVRQHCSLLQQQARLGDVDKLVLTTLRAQKAVSPGCDSQEPGQHAQSQTLRKGVSSPKSSERQPDPRTALPEAGFANPLQPPQPVEHDSPSEDEANLTQFTRWLFSKKFSSTAAKSI